MNAFRKSICVAIALLAAVFSSIAWSQSNLNKHFIFDVQPFQVDNTQQATDLHVSITNDNPSGSSSQVGSFMIQITTTNGSSVHLGITAVTKFSGPKGGTILFSTSGDTTTITVTGINPLKANAVYVLDVTVSGCGDGYIWTAQAWSGPSLNGTQYFETGTDNLIAQKDVNVPCGFLGSTTCNGNGILSGSTVNQFLNSSITDNKGKPLSRRGPNQDGSSCDSLFYYVTDDVNNSALHVRWDKGDPSTLFPGSFFYVLFGPLGPAPAFGWKTDANGDPVFVPAQVCDQGKKAAFPAQYGSLAADVTAGAGTITVNLNKNTNTPATPFRIAIGPKPTLEFLTVTNISQGTWTVTRDPNAKAHSQGDIVMSTPAPALPVPAACVNTGGSPIACPANTYVGGGPALMCYVPTNDTSNSYVFDVGDGWTLGR